MLHIGPTGTISSSVHNSWATKSSLLKKLFRTSIEHSIEINYASVTQINLWIFIGPAHIVGCLCKSERLLLSNQVYWHGKLDKCPSASQLHRGSLWFHCPRTYHLCIKTLQHSNFEEFEICSKIWPLLQIICFWNLIRPLTYYLCIKTLQRSNFEGFEICFRIWPLL